jgi:cytochrome c peroxidase
MARTHSASGRFMQSSRFHIILIIFILALVSCKDDGELILTPVDRATPYTIEIPHGFPTKLNIPADNPMTVEGIALGRYLFYDGRISGHSDPGQQMSCYTCHIQANAFECGINNPDFPGGLTHGVTGIPTPHYMIPLFNQVWNSNGYLWNGSVSNDNADPMRRNIESMLYLAIIAPHEFNSDTTSAVNAIKAVPGYAPLFKAAFGSEDVTIERMGKAVAQFVRTFISSESKFDKYLRGEIQLTPSEINGYVLFVTEEGGDCFHCHGASGNPLFTTNLFYNNAKDSIFDDPHDRFSITGDPAMHGAYKAPSLRNIALTAPYMHDGRYKTLDEVINFYSDSLVYSPYADPLMHHLMNGGVRLTSSEKADLKAFLLTLTDEEFIKNPAFSKPEQIP